MDLLQFQYFQTTARIGHMTKAAEELHIAQPTLSKMINRLENELGVPLFDRSGRQIKLSLYGEVFLDYVNKILEDLDGCYKELNSLKESRNLSISFALNIPSLLTPLLEGFLLINNNINVKDEIGSTPVIRQKLETQDVAFCISCPPIEGKNIQCIPLLEEELFVMVPKKHPLASSKFIKLAEVSREPFLSFKKNHGIRDLTEALCRKAGFTPNIVYEGEVTNSLLTLVRIGMGIALLPGTHPWSPPAPAASVDSPVMLRVEDVPCYRTIALSCLKSRKFSKAETQFKNYILERFADYQLSLEQNLERF